RWLRELTTSTAQSFDQLIGGCNSLTGIGLSRLKGAALLRSSETDCTFFPHSSSNSPFGTRLQSKPGLVLVPGSSGSEYSTEEVGDALSFHRVRSGGSRLPRRSATGKAIGSARDCLGNRSFPAISLEGIAPPHESQIGSGSQGSQGWLHAGPSSR